MIMGNYIIMMPNLERKMFIPTYLWVIFIVGTSFSCQKPVEHYKHFILFTDQSNFISHMKINHLVSFIIAYKNNFGFNFLNLSYSFLSNVGTTQVPRYLHGSTGNVRWIAMSLENTLNMHYCFSSSVALPKFVFKKFYYTKWDIMFYKLLF